MRARTIGTSVTIGALGVGPLIAGLSGLFLVTTLHHPSHALAGAALFLVFAAGLQASRVLALGTVSMLAGLVLLVVSVRVSTASLALFLIAGALIGAGSGAVFKGTSGIVLEASPPQSRVAMTSALLIALYVGLSVPVIGAGIALDLGASAPNTVLGFAILVGLEVVAEKWRPYRSLATSYLFSAVFEPAEPAPPIKAPTARTARRVRDNSKKRPEVA